MKIYREVLRTFSYITAGFMGLFSVAKHFTDSLVIEPSYFLAPIGLLLLIVLDMHRKLLNENEES